MLGVWLENLWPAGSSADCLLATGRPFPGQRQPVSRTCLGQHLHTPPPGADGASPRRALACVCAWSPILSGAARCLLGHCHPPGSLGRGAHLSLVFLWSCGKSGFNKRSCVQRPGRGSCPLLGCRFFIFFCDGHRKQSFSVVHVSVTVGDAFVQRAVTASLTCVPAVTCCTLSSLEVDVLTGSPLSPGPDKGGLEISVC